MPDLEVMQAIEKQWGSLIALICGSSSVPAAFMAALICGESGGKSDSQRFEPAILLRLQAVIAGRANQFRATGIQHALSRQEIIAFVSPSDVPVISSATPYSSLPKYSFPDALTRLEWLATSFGLTQIMGWHSIEFSKNWKLLDPRENLTAATVLLAYFANRYQLDLTKDFEEMFRCWNAGGPTEPTFDPNYVSNGLARIAIWNSLKAA